MGDVYKRQEVQRHPLKAVILPDSIDERVAHVSLDSGNTTHFVARGHSCELPLQILSPPMRSTNTDDLQSETARAWLDSMFHGLRKLVGLRGLRDGVGYHRGSRSALRSGAAGCD